MNKSHKIIADYYQLDDKNRSEAIQMLIEEKTSDAARELISIYQTCEWRDTKFQILKGLSEFLNQRTLQFLFSVATNEKDLPLSEAAIETLSSIKNPMAQRFLFQLYAVGPDYTKSAAIKALSRHPSQRLGELFLVDLALAVKNNYLILAQNLILSLGEIRYHKAIPTLLELIKKEFALDIKTAVVVSLGKLLRETGPLISVEEYIKRDPVTSQLFVNSLNQIQFRNQWKLEDYLQKYFLNEHPHPAILNEISSYDPKEIEAGLSLFEEEKFTLKRMTLLFQTSPQSVNFDRIQNENIHQDCLHLIAQYGDQMQYAYLKKNSQPSNKVWLNAVAWSQPQAYQIFQDVIQGESFEKMDTATRIEIMNSFSDALYLISFDLKKMQAVSKWLEKEFLVQTDTKLMSRWVRLFADHKIESRVITQWIIKHMHEESFTDCALYLMERCPQLDFKEALKQLAPNLKPTQYLQLVKSAKSQDIEAHEYSQWQSLLKVYWQDNRIDLQIEIFRFLSVHPIEGFEKQVMEALSAKDHSLQLQAILAAKRYRNEIFSEPLSALLQSRNLSVQGRAFDALLSYPILRAQRKSIDFFKEKFKDKAIFQKFVRSFIIPKTDSTYFYDVLVEVSQKIESSTDKEFLSELLNRYQLQNSETLNKTKPKAEDLLKIDKFLESKINEYGFLDENIKQTLRSAEIPFHHPEMYDEFIDKSAIILGYAKAIDLILEKVIGRKSLLPNLEKRIFEFQNTIQVLGLHMEYPHAEFVLKNLLLDKHFTAHSLPVHKMSLIGNSIMNTKILNDSFKVLDGLRAWAVILLVFCRKNHLQPKACLSGFQNENLIIELSKKLLWLQDIRNPVAHRQTVVDFKMLHQVRAECLNIFKMINEL